MSYEYSRPKTLAEALEQVSEAGSRCIAGGTDLLVALRKKKRSAPTRLVSLRSLAELNGIREEDSGLRIGACTPLTDILKHPAAKNYPALISALRVLGSRQIRNVATLGGNLCNASPAADSAPPLLVYDASVELAGPSGNRSLALCEFFLAPGRAALQPGEILTSVLLPRPKGEARSCFLRRSRVAMDLATVSLAAGYRLRDGHLTDLRLAVGAAAPTPSRLAQTEAFLEGATPDPETLRRAAEIARGEVSPISDLRGSEWYRRELVGVFLARALRTREGDVL